MPVSEAIKLHARKPVIVHSGDSLLDAARAMIAKPQIHVAAVISSTGHLLGVVTLRKLADHIFFSITPEVFYSEVASNLDRSLDFGEMANVHNISDIMIDPIAVHANDTVGQAFRLMHKNDLTGLPVVDDNNHVVGYVGLNELLELMLQHAQ